MSNKVWMRLGIELDLSFDEFTGLISGRYSVPQILELIQSSRSTVVGNSYFPVIRQNGPLAGFEWTFPRTPAARFFVDTPEGVLVAQKAGDTDYPGVEVELKSAEDDVPNTTLSLTEYIPGGEGISDFDLSHPGEMARQQAEIPPERCRTGADGRTQVSAGFVTRAWPNEAARQDYHHRVFHYGYK